MADLLKVFNDMLAGLPSVSGLSHVSYLDLRALLSNQLAGNAYKKSLEQRAASDEKRLRNARTAFNDLILTL
jgi:hypothetical protein